MQRGLLRSTFQAGIVGPHHRPERRGGTVEFGRAPSGQGGWFILLHTLTLGPSTATASQMSCDITHLTRKNDLFAQTACKLG